jgi:NAD(P)-dependent dehydrogenase (short-subunit alcohol dehydrogenase family)
MSSQTAVYPSLAGRTVFITGGGSGIGASLTRAFARQKAHVAFVDIAVDASRRLVDDIHQSVGVEPLFLPCDLRDIDALKASIETTRERLGKIGVLLNNAANDDRHHVAEVTPAQWDERIAINLRPMFFAAQAVAPQMRALGGGSIINFGSICWRIGTSDLPIYSTAKAAAHGLSRSLAHDLGVHGIRVNTLSPGCVMTERQLQLWVTPGKQEVILENQYLKRLIQPDHIAQFALFLAADDSAMCTAQEIIVDAGWA